MNNKSGTGDIFLGHPERARVEIGGADQHVLKRRELPGFARVNTVTSASQSLGNNNQFSKKTLLSNGFMQQFSAPGLMAHAPGAGTGHSACRS